MKIHEYQGKALLRDYSVPVPRGMVARTPDEAEAAAKELGTDIVVVKGTDPCWRPRQGRRCKACEITRRS